MQTPIKDMYTAAKVNLPAQGDMVTGVANNLQVSLDELNQQAAYAGDHPAMTSLLHVGGDIHSVLLTAVTSLDNMAAALIAAADHYVATDDQARADYEALSAQTRNAPLPDHAPNPLEDPNPEAGGFEVTPTGPPGPPLGPPVHVDPSPDPGSADDEQDDRADQEPDAPAVPRPEQEF